MNRIHVSNQILDVKQRAGRHGTSIHEATNQLEKLRIIVSDADTREDIIRDFIPIRIATCIEVIVRNLIREIIDYGEPYSGRAEKYAKLIKFDFLLSNAIQGQRLTLGDIISHSVSINSLSQIISIFDNLLCNDFREQLITTKSRSALVLAGNDDPIITEPDNVFRLVDQILNIRHIVVHEMPATRPYQANDLEHFIKAAGEFLVALDELVTKELRGDFSVTQQEMNAEAYTNLTEARRESASMIRSIRAQPDFNREAFLLSQKSWKKYCDAEARFTAAIVEDGSLWPLIYAETSSKLVKDRTSELSWWLEREEGEL